MILVAGGTGLLGRLVVARLIDAGRSVRVLTRDPVAANDLVDSGVELVTGDVRDPGSLGPALSGVSTVVTAVHGLAGPGGVTPETVDREGNRNLINAAALGAQPAEVILVSTVGASPNHPMELFRMKWAAEEHLRTSGLPWTIVRSNAFIQTWVELLRQTAGTSGRPRVFGRGDNPINFVWAQDVADAVVRSAVDPAVRGQVIEVGGPGDLTLNQLARMVQGSMGSSGALHHVPRPALRAMGVLARPFNPTMARLARASVVMDTCDLTFDAGASTRAYPWLSCTPIEEHGVLARP
ncbi:MAG: SDR family oxidoreductase [Dermatophilaceae bacterium]